MLIEHKICLAWIFNDGRLCKVEGKHYDFLLELKESNRALTVKEQKKLREILDRCWLYEPKEKKI